MGGNFYQSKPEVGIYDASYGVVLKGDGKGNFIAEKANESGFSVRGAIRSIIEVKAGKLKLILTAQNNSTVKILKLN